MTLCKAEFINGALKVRQTLWLKCKKASEEHFRGLMIISVVAPEGDPVQDNFQSKDTFP